MQRLLRDYFNPFKSLCVFVMFYYFFYFIISDILRTGRNSHNHLLLIIFHYCQHRHMLFTKRMYYRISRKDISIHTYRLRFVFQNFFYLYFYPLLPFLLFHQNFSINSISGGSDSGILCTVTFFISGSICRSSFTSSSHVP